MYPIQKEIYRRLISALLEEIGLLDLSNYPPAIVSVALFLLANVQVDRKSNNQKPLEIADAWRCPVHLRERHGCNYLTSHLWAQLTHCLINVRARVSEPLFKEYYFMCMCSDPSYLANIRSVCCFLKWSNFFLFFFSFPFSFPSPFE